MTPIQPKFGVFNKIYIVRKIINTVIAVVILVGAVFYAQHLIESNERVKPPVKKIIKTVFVQKAINGEVPITAQSSGTVSAKHRLELYAEVQGVFDQSAAEFRSGQAYKKNQILIGLDAREYSASLVAAKSEFQNLVIGVLPDLRLDYADAYAAWSQYAKGFNVTAPLVDLPQANNEAEQFFITGRGIVAAFYSVKNMEERLAKYTIGAPFDGVLTDASVTKGTLVRAGQKLGEYIDTRSYELALSVTPAISNLLEIGAPVSMTSREGGQDFFGTIARINQKVDQATQMVQVFVVSIDERLKEGMYLEAELPARTQALAIKLPRKLLVNESFIYVVRDSVLDLVLVDPVYFTPNDMVVTGIPENTAVVVKPVAGAYAGMLVQIYDEKATEQSDQNKQ